MNAMIERGHHKGVTACLAFIIDHFNGIGAAAIIDEMAIRYEFYPDNMNLVSVHLSQMKKRGLLKTQEIKCGECAKPVLIYSLSDKGRMHYEFKIERLKQHANTASTN